MGLRLLVCLQIASICTVNLKSLHQFRPPTETAHWFQLYCTRDKSVPPGISQTAFKVFQINMANKHLLKMIIFLEFTLKDFLWFFTSFMDLVHRWKIDYDYNSDWTSYMLFWNVLASKTFCFQYESSFCSSEQVLEILTITILITETWDYFSGHFCSSKVYFNLFLSNVLKQWVVTVKLLNRFH